MNLNRILKASIMLACALVQVHATDLSSTTDTDDIVEFTHPTNQQKFHISRNLLETKYPNSMLHLLANPRGAGDMQRSLTLDKTPEGHEQYLPDAVNYINSGGFPVDKDNHSLIASLNYYGALTPQAFKEYEWSLELRQHYDELKQKYENYVNAQIDQIFEFFVPKFLEHFKTSADYESLNIDPLCLHLYTKSDIHNYRIKSAVDLIPKTERERLQDLQLDNVRRQHPECYAYECFEKAYRLANDQISKLAAEKLENPTDDERSTIDQATDLHFKDSVKIEESLARDDRFKPRLNARLNDIFPVVTWLVPDKTHPFHSISVCPQIKNN